MTTRDDNDDDDDDIHDGGDVDGIVTDVIAEHDVQADDDVSEDDINVTSTMMLEIKILTPDDGQ